MGLGHNGHWDSYSMLQGQNGTGTEKEWYTQGLGLSGTGTQCGLGQNGTRTQMEWYRVGMGLNGTGTQFGTGAEWDRNLKGNGIQCGTGTQRDWYTVWHWDRLGQDLRGNGTQCDWDSMGLVYSVGLGKNGTGT